MERIRREVKLESGGGRRYYHDLGSNKIIGGETSLRDEVFSFFKPNLRKLPMDLLKLFLIPGLIALGWYMRDKTYHPEKLSTYEEFAYVDDRYVLRWDPNLSSWDPNNLQFYTYTWDAELRARSQTKTEAFK